MSAAHVHLGGQGPSPATKGGARVTVPHMADMYPAVRNVPVYNVDILMFGAFLRS